MLEPKERALLLALSETEYCTSEMLAKAMGVSSRTARTMVSRLKEKLKHNGADILARTHHGYILQVEDRQKFNALCEGRVRSKRFIPSNGEERVYYLLVMLLCQVEYIKLDDISAELYVSKYTITGDLRRVEGMLAEYNLRIQRRPNYGMQIVGRETDIRNCIAHTLTNYSNMMPDGGEGYREMAQVISQLLLETVQRFNLHFPEINFRNLVNMIFAIMHRTLQYCFIPLSQGKEDGTDQYADTLPQLFLDAARWLANAMGKEFRVELPQQEIQFLALNMAGRHNYGSIVPAEDENVEIAPALMKLVDSMLESIYETFKLDYRGNFLLRMNLGQHMVALDIRLRYGLPVENPLLGEVQLQYSLAYALAEQASIPLRHAYQVVVSEDEVGYLAYIFQLALEQEKDGFKKKNILIVCAAGIASSKLIAYRFQEEFSKYIDRTYLCDAYHLDSFDMSKVDYIFSSVPIRKKVAVPVIRVEDFLNSSSVQIVRNILAGSSSGFVSAYYRKELFFPHISGSTKEEVLFNLCNLIDQVIPLPQGFYSAVLKREELARTDFCPLVAFPHPYKVMNKETFVAVGILDEPIRWVKNDVQVLFLISIGEQEHPELQNFYLSITSFMQDTDRVKSLIVYRDFAWFMQLLCGGATRPEELDGK